jgi:hypothetical protein
MEKTGLNNKTLHLLKKLYTINVEILPPPPPQNPLFSFYSTFLLLLLLPNRG